MDTNLLTPVAWIPLLRLHWWGLGWRLPALGLLGISLRTITSAPLHLPICVCWRCRCWRRYGVCSCVGLVNFSPFRDTTALGRRPFLRFGRWLSRGKQCLVPLLGLLDSSDVTEQIYELQFQVVLTLISRVKSRDQTEHNYGSDITHAVH